MTGINRKHRPHGIRPDGIPLSLCFMLMISLMIGGCAAFEKEMKSILRPLEADLRPLLQPWYKDYGFKKLPDTREFAAIPRLMRALRDPNSTTRREAARALGIIGPDAFEAVPELIRRLEDAHFDVRRQAAIALERIDPHDYPEVTLLVLMNALEDRQYSRARAAAVAIGKMGPDAKSAVRALMATMDNQNNWYENYRYVRVEAARALGLIGPDARDAVPSLVEAMYSLDPELRREAARAIGNIGPAAGDAIPILARALDETFVFPISRRDMHQSLNPLGDTVLAEFIDRIDAERINQFLRPVGRHWIFDHAMRREAARALGQIGHEASKAVPALIAAMTRQGKWCGCKHDVRLESIRTLGKIGASARTAVLPLANIVETDPSSKIRREALRTLASVGSLNTEGVFSILLKALNDFEPEVRIQAIRTLTTYELNYEKGERLEWNPADDGRCVGFMVCYSSGANPEQCRDVGANTTFDVGDLNPTIDAVYRFRIHSYDHDGETTLLHQTSWVKRDVLPHLRLVMMDDMNENVRMEARESVRRLTLLRGP